MDLTHSFTVPTSVDVTWAHFQDIGALAECFPGAQVTSVGQDDSGSPTFEGTCKVKLGPIALVYTGSGAFVENDEAAHRFVVDAKGRDKRGNGTAGAKVTVSMRAASSGGDATDVEVLTDLAITGKPAQFGRGVMQDVSDKLLGQFVDCLEQRLAGGDSGAAAAGGGTGVDQDSGPASAPTGAAAVGSPADDPDAGPASVPGPEAGGPASGGQSSDGQSPGGQSSGGQSSAGPARPDDSLDLGAAVLPVLLKSYGKQVAAAVGALLVLRLLVRVLRR